LISPPAGSVSRIAVLIEWRDTNVTNTTFEGTAREILRVGFNGTIHPMGDLTIGIFTLPMVTAARVKARPRGQFHSGSTRCREKSSASLRTSICVPQTS
jgi:hypothetical protein